jgi:hypothetical protein
MQKRKKTCRNFNAKFFRIGGVDVGYLNIGGVPDKGKSSDQSQPVQSHQLTFFVNITFLARGVIFLATYH